jgi:hypothetical protein
LSQSSDDGTDGGFCVDDISRTNDLSIPLTQQIYDVTIDGEVATEEFSDLNAVLIVRPMLDTEVELDSDNDLNVRDVGLFSEPFTRLPQAAGEIRFATNTAIHAQPAVGIDVPDGLTAVDVAFVDVVEDADVLTVTPDVEFTAEEGAEELNAIAAPATAGEEEITGGTMTLEFAGGGETVTGNIVFTGGGSAQAEPITYNASISGNRQSQ